MVKDCEWGHKIFSTDEVRFGSLALEIFRFQYAGNPVYKAYVDALGMLPSAISSIQSIPFLPISFFKSHQVQTNSTEADVVFESSGTTASINSKHSVADITIYEESFIKGFERFYGPVNEWNIIGLLPSYLERGNSSLVYMVNKLIQLSGREASGFYLNEFEKLANVLLDLERKQEKALLIGVTFALLDFAEKYSIPLRNTIIMETGGMKGRRKEMIRDEVHEQLKKAFHLPAIHSEYGMTELMSQAYSKGNGVFECPPWMKVLTREEDDPLTIQHSNGVTKGALNVIDLANVYSCSFIATDDAGRVFPDGSFEVQGRMDSSDIRGCNLLIA